MTQLDPLTELQKNIKQQRSCGFSYEAIGKRYGLNRAMARLLEKGYVPGKKIRSTLGLPNISTIVVIGEGEIPDGTQAITARRCECGQWYVPNSGNRTHCFICRPYARRGKIARIGDER
jgi:hypothetical protein